MSSTHLSNSLLPDLSHIYVETRALDHAVTKRVMAKFKHAKVIEIAHYKDLFNQKGEDFRAQKSSMKLILAIKEPPFLYEGSQYADGFGFDQFYYTPSMLNCLYDCDYCYLQGMYSSANMVVFVNREEFFKATLPYLDKPMLVCTSYDTDLLAVEGFIGENRDWLEFAKIHPNLFLEIRTKSANFKSISDIEVNLNVVLAWTLSPQESIDRYEKKTPSLVQRLSAIDQALSKGWKVRLCLDPIIIDEAFERIYPVFIELLFATVDASKLFEVTIGAFRMSSDHLKQIKKMGHTPLAFYPYAVSDKMAVYPRSIEANALNRVETMLLKYINKEMVRIWRQP